jgi:nitrite reductase/ring-hydroxylating ferredoxin subunit/uncharacterized membrane protein
MASETTGTHQDPPTTSWMDTPPRSPMLRHYSAQLIAKLPWLDTLSTSVQKLSNEVFGAPKDPSYRFKDFLAGVWFGHPVHPALVIVPIGSWSASLILDLAWLADPDDGVARSSDLLLLVGLTSAVGAAATGIANWVDTDGQDQRTGMLHALLNSGATVLNLSSLLLRVAGQRRTAIALAGTAFTLIVYSAYIGGGLAYANGVGFNRVVPEGGSDDFVAVIDEKDLEPNKLTRVDAAGIAVVLLKDGSTIHAIAATCSHLGGPLDEGSYEDGVVSCPWHNSGFRMCDGSVVNSPAIYAQPTFAVRIRAGKVELRRLEHA